MELDDPRNRVRRLPRPHPSIPFRYSPISEHHQHYPAAAFNILRHNDVESGKMDYLGTDRRTLSM